MSTFCRSFVGHGSSAAAPFLAKLCSEIPRRDFVGRLCDDMFSEVFRENFEDPAMLMLNIFALSFQPRSHPQLAAKSAPPQILL